MTMKGLGSEDGLCIILSRLESLGTSCKVLWHAVEQSPHWQLFTAVWLEIATLLALKMLQFGNLRSVSANGVETDHL